MGMLLYIFFLAIGFSIATTSMFDDDSLEDW